MRGIVRLGMGRRYSGRFENPNEPETNVNLRQHVRYEDTVTTWSPTPVPRLG